MIYKLPLNRDQTCSEPTSHMTAFAGLRALKRLSHSFSPRCVNATNLIRVFACNPCRKMATGAGPIPYTPRGKVPPGLVDNSWGMQHQEQKYGALTSDAGEVDVVVVGAGIAGLNTALHLAKNGKSVAVVEARTRGSGQTGRTSAHIMQWHDDFYSHLEGKYGRANTRLVAESMLEAINFIEHTVKEENISCAFRRLNGYLIPAEIPTKQSSFTESVKQSVTLPSFLHQLDTELKACHRAGMMDVKKVDLGGEPYYGSVRDALLFPRSAEFHPLDYINGLSEVLVTKYHVQLYEMSRVMINDVGVHGLLKTRNGGRIKARQAVVLATNSPINRNVAIHARQEAWRTYMLACAVPRGSVESANWWTAEDIYRYIRLCPGDEQRDTLLIGGGDHLSGQAANKYVDVWASLEAYLRQRFPQAQEVTARWSGQVYEPADELGLYGLDPANPINFELASQVTAEPAGEEAHVTGQQHVKHYIATGDSGQGMTGGAIAAMVIGDAILGRDNPWKDLYSPSRFKTLLAPSSLKELGSEVAATVSGLVSWGVLRDLEDVKGAVLGTMPHLKPGEGAVVQEGLHKVAVFKDPVTGELHRRSAMCTHLGCLISWNPNDRTFDCCCHGSQFSATGQCINGPAAADLEDLGQHKPTAPEPSPV